MCICHTRTAESVWRTQPPTIHLSLTCSLLQKLDDRVSGCGQFQRLLVWVWDKREELAERRKNSFDLYVGMVWPDLWWGSSACRAEPAGSLSVGKPVPRGNLQPWRSCKNPSFCGHVSRTRQTLTEVGLVGTAFEFDPFGTCLDQEVSHQLIGQVTN